VHLVAVIVTMAEEDLTIKLKPVTGDMFTVEYKKSGTILGLKEELCKTYGATPEQIRLIYKGSKTDLLFDHSFIILDTSLLRAKRQLTTSYPSAGQILKDHQTVDSYGEFNMSSANIHLFCRPHHPDNAYFLKH
jgi:hypothetical protein